MQPSFHKYNLLDSYRIDNYIFSQERVAGLQGLQTSGCYVISRLYFANFIGTICFHEIYG